MKKLPSLYATHRPPLTDYQKYVIGGFGKFESFVLTLGKNLKNEKKVNFPNVHYNFLFNLTFFYRSAEMRLDLDFIPQHEIG